MANNTNVLMKLQKVQRELKAPKNLYNSFGRYNYRNAEAILEGFKPLGEKLGLALVLTDAVEAIGNRVYIKATATIYDSESGESISACSYAREPENKKGMDESQLSGSTSSYARKYCLNGLFCLDDTKDADSDEYTAKTREAAPSVPQPVAQPVPQATPQPVQQRAAQPSAPTYASQQTQDHNAAPRQNEAPRQQAKPATPQWGTAKKFD